MCVKSPGMLKSTGRYVSNFSLFWDSKQPGMEEVMALSKSLEKISELEEKLGDITEDIKNLNQLLRDRGQELRSLSNPQ